MAPHTTSLPDSDVYGRLGLIEPGKVDLGERAIEDVISLLQHLGSSMRRYEDPSLWGRFCRWFRANGQADGVTVEVVKLDSFYAKVGLGKPNPIVIAMGAVLRTASLCYEFAAVTLEGATGPAVPSIHAATQNGGMFYLIPQSVGAKLYAKRLLLIGMLVLFGHEFSHVCFGHCNLLSKEKELSDDDRCAIELDADIGAGTVAAASIIQSREVLNLMGYSSADFDSGAGNDFINDAMTAVFIQFVLFEEFSDKSSPRYLVPQIRLINFIANFVKYIDWSSQAPFGPAVHLNKEFLKDDYVKMTYLETAGKLMSTSIAPVIQNSATTEADYLRFMDVARIREKLKTKLAPLQPFGMPAYLAAVRKNSVRKNR